MRTLKTVPPQLTAERSSTNIKPNLPLNLLATAVAACFMTTAPETAYAVPVSTCPVGEYYVQ